MAVVYKGITTIYEREKVGLFEIDTAHGSVYMCCYPSLCMNNRAVVIMDSEKFLRLWRNDTYEAHLHLSRGNPVSWMTDYKYKDAGIGFSEGKENPVPLAEIDFETRPNNRFLSALSLKQSEYVSFTNGVTRTIWLLCNGADSFPVEVSAESADSLRKAAGSAAHQSFTTAKMFD